MKIVDMTEEWPKRTVDNDGIIRYKNKDNKYHREDGPAYEGSDGTKSWWLNGKRHREDGPAYEGSNGTKSWWLNGERHREDGPAIELSNGTKSWYLNGKLHREDGPAKEWSNGTKSWWLNGKLHREDGPAREYPDGTKEWWLNDEKVNEEDGMDVEVEWYYDNGSVILKFGSKTIDISNKKIIDKIDSGDRVDVEIMVLDRN